MGELNKDATEEESKSGKREERKGKGWRLTVQESVWIVCLAPALCGEPFEVFSDAEVESAGISWDVS